VEQAEIELAGVDRVEDPTSVNAWRVVANSPARTSITVIFHLAGGERVDDPHLVGRAGDVHDVGDAGMEALDVPRGIRYRRPHQNVPRAR